MSLIQTVHTLLSSQSVNQSINRVSFGDWYTICGLHLNIQHDRDLYRWNPSFYRYATIKKDRGREKQLISDHKRIMCNKQNYDNQTASKASQPNYCNVVCMGAGWKSTTASVSQINISYSIRYTHCIDLAFVVTRWSSMGICVCVCVRLRECESVCVRVSERETKYGLNMAIVVVVAAVAITMKLYTHALSANTEQSHTHSFTHMTICMFVNATYPNGFRVI